MTLQTVNEDDACRSCGQSFGWHQLHNPRHPFNSGQDGATDFLKRRGDRTGTRRSPTSQDGSEGPQIMSLTSDPVLRIALINRGILTPADLVVAEESLKSALAHVKQEEEWLARGVGRPDSSTPTDKTSTEH